MKGKLQNINAGMDLPGCVNLAGRVRNLARQQFHRRAFFWALRMLLIGQLLLPAASAPAPLYAAQNAPSADFSTDVEAGLAPLSVQFHDESSGAPTDWQWNFGDGTLSTAQHPSHVYTTPGAYSVTLRVSNGAGADTVHRKNLIIANGPLVHDIPPEELPWGEKQIYVPIVQVPPSELSVQAAAAPNTPALQSPANGATGVANPTAALEACASDPDGGNLTLTFYGRDISSISVPDFTVAALPDTQFYYGYKGTKAMFQAQVDWLVSNKSSRNILFVSHLGDVVQDGSVPGATGESSADGKSDDQWVYADQVMATIENPTTTGLPDGMPYGIAVGNHDQTDSSGDPSKTQLYNQYFGVSRFSGRGYYGGHLGSDNDNSYQLFSAGDLDFIAIALEFDTSRPGAAFTWVNSLLETHADRWAIISAHEILHSSGSWRPQGTAIWNAVKAHPNVLLMLSGHHSGEASRSETGYGGNKVNMMVSDYQGRANGGDGWMRYMEFSGSSSTMTVNTYSPHLNQAETDSNSLFNVDWDTPKTGPFRRPFEIIGQKSISSGACTSVNWSGLQTNHEYEWYVGVTDTPGDLDVAQVFSSRNTFTTANINALNFSASNVDKAEDGGSATITVNLSRANSNPVSVQYATSNGTATAGGDYSAASGTLNFGAAETSKTFTVNILDDSLFEGDETINLTLSNPTNAVIGAAAATLTIVEDEIAPVITLEAATYAINENDGALAVNVLLDKAADVVTTVQYATSNGTAANTSDYVAQSGALTFNPGETSKSLSIPIVDNSTAESTETFNLALSNPVKAALGTPASATVTIIDDDSTLVEFSSNALSVDEDAGSATIVVELNSVAAVQVKVDYAVSNGTAQSGSDYSASNGAFTFAPGEISKSFTVTIVDNAIDELDETIQLKLSNASNATLGANANATLTIVDDDAALLQFSDSSYSMGESDSVGAEVTVALTTAADRTVTVDYATADDTAVAGDDYTAISGTLTFAPGETSQTFTVNPIDDEVVEENENVALSLTNPQNAALGTLASAQLTIADDDVAGVSFTTATFDVNESAGQALISVRLNAPASQTVMIDYATADDTATAGADYTASSGTLTFAPGETNQSFSVPILDDQLDESDESVMLMLSSPVNVELGKLTSALLTIADDDELQIQLGAASYVVDEDGELAVSVTLNAPSAQTITVDYATGDDSAAASIDYTAQSGTLTFAPGETSQEIAIPIIDDALDEPVEGFTLALSNPQNVILGAPDSASITIVDNDVVRIAFSRATYDVAEDAGQATIEVTLTVPSVNIVAVDFAASGGLATAGSDYEATSGTLTFAPGETRQSFAVSILDDALEEDNETVVLTLSNPQNGALGTPAAADLRILDDERVSVQFDALSHAVVEGDGSVDVDVVLSAPSALSVVVAYAATGGTAKAGADYGPAADTVTFAAGETRKTITIDIQDDPLDEPEETIVLSLQNPSNANIGPAADTTINISDNDDFPVVYLTQPRYRQSSSDPGGALTFGIELSHGSAMTVSVDYLIGDDQIMAEEGIPITPTLRTALPLTGTISVEPGATNAMVTLDDELDVLFNGNTTLNVALIGALNAALDPTNRALPVLVTRTQEIYLPLIQR
ncbi:MAG: Calx-beta domain-containing protein [Caldilineaceae bacterium]